LGNEPLTGTALKGREHKRSDVTNHWEKEHNSTTNDNNTGDPKKGRKEQNKTLHGSGRKGQNTKPTSPCQL